MSRLYEHYASQPDHEFNRGYRFGIEEAAHLHQKRVDELWQQFEAEKLGLSEEADTPTFRLYDGTVIDGPEVVIYDSVNTGGIA